MEDSMDFLNQAIDTLKSVDASESDSPDHVKHLVLLCECYIHLSTLQDEKEPGGEAAEKSYEAAGKLCEQVKTLDPSAIPKDVSDLFDCSGSESESMKSNSESAE
jgi:hypothetical protein